MVPEVILSSEDKVSRLVSATLCEISNQDFPDRWPGLLPVCSCLCWTRLTYFLGFGGETAIGRFLSNKRHTEDL